jgi:hypothetical protein
MTGDEKYSALLRSELTRAQALLKRAETACERLLDQNRALCALLDAHGIGVPENLRAEEKR